MNLVGFFLRDLLRTKLVSERAQRIARQMSGTILFNASGMQTSVIFRRESIEIYSGVSDIINSKITGDLNALLDVALGENYLKFVLTGKIRIGGNVLKLLKFLQLLSQ